MVKKVEVFTSPSCPHCPAAKEVVELAKKELGDAIDVFYYDTMSPEGRELAISYGIMYVPAIAIDGSIDFVGAPALPELLEKLQ